MSYSPRAMTKAGAPAVTDDSSKGYTVGSLLVNTSSTPRSVYVCTNPAAGAAVWVLLGAALVAFTTSIYPYDSVAVLSITSTPASAATSNGTIGGP